VRVVGGVAALSEMKPVAANIKEIAPPRAWPVDGPVSHLPAQRPGRTAHRVSRRSRKNFLVKEIQMKIILLTMTCAWGLMAAPASDAVAVKEVTAAMESLKAGHAAQGWSGA